VAIIILTFSTHIFFPLSLVKFKIIYFFNIFFLYSNLKIKILLILFIMLKPYLIWFNILILYLNIIYLLKNH